MRKMCELCEQLRLGKLSLAVFCMMFLFGAHAQTDIIKKAATHATLAQKNLNHSLERARRLSAGRPNDPTAAQGLVDLLLMRLQFYRNYDDLNELKALCEPWSNDARAAAQYLCADVDAARHDFESALNRLSLASERGGSCASTQRRLSAIGATLEVSQSSAGGQTTAKEPLNENYATAVLAAARATSRADHSAAINYYKTAVASYQDCLLYTSPSPRDKRQSRMPSSA